MKLELKDIHVTDRMRSQLGDILSMKASLERMGQIQAILVRPSEPSDQTDAPWVLVAGGRRCAAASLVGWTYLWGVSRDQLSAYWRKAIELEENVVREELPWQDVVRAKRELHELYQQEHGPGWGMNQTAMKLKETAVSTTEDIALAKAMDEHPELSTATSKKKAKNMLKHAKTVKSLKSSMKNFDFRKVENAVICADAVEWLQTLQDDSVDLFCVDYPYGIDYFEMPSSERQAGGGTAKFDDRATVARHLIKKTIPIAARKVKATGWLVFFCSREQESLLRALFKDINASLPEDHPKQFLVEDINWIWYRPNSRNNPNYPDLHARNDYDIMVVVNAGKARLLTVRGNVFVYNSIYDDTRIHDHQKPVELYVDILERTTIPGQFVVDYCFGSASSLAAAARTGRQFAGCDSNPNILNPARRNVIMHAMENPGGFQMEQMDPSDDESNSDFPDALDDDPEEDLLGIESDEDESEDDELDLDNEDEDLEEDLDDLDVDDELDEDDDDEDLDLDDED